MNGVAIGTYYNNSFFSSLASQFVCVHESFWASNSSMYVCMYILCKVYLLLYCHFTQNFTLLSSFSGTFIYHCVTMATVHIGSNDRDHPNSSPISSPRPPLSPMPHSPMPYSPMPHSPMPHSPMPHSPMPHSPMPHSPMPHSPMPHVSWLLKPSWQYYNLTTCLCMLYVFFNIHSPHIKAINVVQSH